MPLQTGNPTAPTSRRPFLTARHSFLATLHHIKLTRLISFLYRIPPQLLSEYGCRRPCLGARKYTLQVVPLHCVPSLPGLTSRCPPFALPVSHEHSQRDLATGAMRRPCLGARKYTLLAVPLHCVPSLPALTSRCPLFALPVNTPLMS